MPIASKMSLSDVDGDLKGKNGFPFSPGPDGALQHPAVGEIDRAPRISASLSSSPAMSKTVRFLALSKSPIRSTSDCAVASPRARPKNGQAHDSGGS
jgi:hypothetical protein